MERENYFIWSIFLSDKFYFDFFLFSISYQWFLLLLLYIVHLHKLEPLQHQKECSSHHVYILKLSKGILDSSYSYFCFLPNQEDVFRIHSNIRLLLPE